MEISVDKQRLQEELDRLATFSDAPPPAVTRILFTKTELAARSYIRSLMRDAGLEVREDALGNIFGRWVGADDAAPAVATGSHIDAIPHSGMYDGTVGVLGAIEAVRALKAAEFTPQRSIEVIMFTAEEPTRFGLGCLGSRAMSGQYTVDMLKALSDRSGEPLETVRKAAGYTKSLDTVKLEPGHYHRFVELHIEQGPLLERNMEQIGIVTAIAAPATLHLTIEGEGGHAGALLMPDRRDALVAASELIVEVEKAAKSTGRLDSVATVGKIDVHPGAVNSVPSRVTLEIDIRDTGLAARDGMVAFVKSAIASICAKRGTRYTLEVINADPPCDSSPEIIAAAESATRRLNLRARRMVSRAYHDALFMAQICPSGMIFIPCRNGYSHRPEEYSSPDQIKRGVDVLAHTLAQLSTA